jgi:hypothetical protein
LFFEQSPLAVNRMRIFLSDPSPFPQGLLTPNG